MFPEAQGWETGLSRCLPPPTVQSLVLNGIRSENTEALLSDEGYTMLSDLLSANEPQPFATQANLNCQRCRVDISAPPFTSLFVCASPASLEQLKMGKAQQVTAQEESRKSVEKDPGCEIQARVVDWPRGRARR